MSCAVVNGVRNTEGVAAAAILLDVCLLGVVDMAVKLGSVSDMAAKTSDTQ